MVALVLSQGPLEYTSGPHHHIIKGLERKLALLKTHALKDVEEPDKMRHSSITSLASSSTKSGYSMASTTEGDPTLATKLSASKSNPQKVPIPNVDISDESVPPIPDPEISYVTLDRKPTAKLHYTYYPASKPRNNHSNPFSQTLIVFLNGLMLPRSSWDPTIKHFLENRLAGQLPYPALLSYDRYGQGDSDHDPDDSDPPPSHSHDAISAVKALKQLTLEIWRDHLDASKPTHYPCLIFVCNSIGCALARLYAQCYPGTVSGLLFLDSIMANSDSQDIWPNPDAPDFKHGTLPNGVSEDDIRQTRKAYKEMFHPDVPNNEGLSRKNLAELLPDAAAPRLEGYLGRGPYLTVVGHDWDTFAEQSYQGPLRTSKLLTMTYANPAWQRYNESLIQITDEGRAIGPLIAVRCGHFIQRDDPRFVSDEMVSLLDRVVRRIDQVSERD